MSKTLIEKAEKKLSQRKFNEVKSMLESNVIHYRDSFYFFYLLGTACLYANDFQGAKAYYQRARGIKIRDPNLLLGQAALYLRRCDVPSALEYYLEVLEYKPDDKTAKKALSFIKNKGNPEVVAEWRDSGKIEKFYPPIKKEISGNKIAFSFFIAVMIPVFVVVFFKLANYVKDNSSQRADLSVLELSRDQKDDATSLGDTYQYILTEKEIFLSYESAQKYFQTYHDNLAQVEINRLLYSNASTVIKRNARILMDYLAEPGFDSIKDLFSYSDVVKDPYLYLDCYVIWKGSVTNITYYENSVSCDFLVGYEKRNKLEGIVPLVIDSYVQIDSERPIEVLAQITLEDKQIKLKGRAIYQPMITDK